MNKVEILTWKDFWHWARDHFRRKFTVIPHIVAGAFCAILYYWYPGLAVLLFITFAVFEKWQHSSENDGGHLDLLDGLFGAFLGASILAILTWVGVLL